MALSLATNSQLSIATGIGSTVDEWNFARDFLSVFVALWLFLDVFFD
jgi:hypothetical protein